MKKRCWTAAGIKADMALTWLRIGIRPFVTRRYSIEELSLDDQEETRRYEVISLQKADELGHRGMEMTAWYKMEWLKSGNILDMKKFLK